MPRIVASTVQEACWAFPGVNLIEWVLTVLWVARASRIVPLKVALARPARPVQSLAVLPLFRFRVFAASKLHVWVRQLRCFVVVSCGFGGHEVVARRM